MNASVFFVIQILHSEVHKPASDITDISSGIDLSQKNPEDEDLNNTKKQDITDKEDEVRDK